jgi:hypothetical protein
MCYTYKESEWNITRYYLKWGMSNISLYEQISDLTQFSFPVFSYNKILSNSTFNFYILVTSVTQKCTVVYILFDNLFLKKKKLKSTASCNSTSDTL